jgi:hypothetical protein
VAGKDTEQARVKWKAFEPSPRDNTTSVFRVRGLSDHGIWSLAATHVEPTRKKRVFGRAEITVSQIREAGTELGTVLSVDVDDTPPRHAAIVGWPEKSQAKALCQELAARAKLITRPASDT